MLHLEHFPLFWQSHIGGFSSHSHGSTSPQHPEGSGSGSMILDFEKWLVSHWMHASCFSKFSKYVQWAKQSHMTSAFCGPRPMPRFRFTCSNCGGFATFTAFGQVQMCTPQRKALGSACWNWKVWDEMEIIRWSWSVHFFWFFCVYLFFLLVLKSASYIQFMDTFGGWRWLSGVYCLCASRWSASGGKSRSAPADGSAID